VGVRGESGLVRGEDVAEPYLVVSRCDKMNSLKKQRLNMGKKTYKIYSHSVVIYPLIPVIPRHGYAVCSGVSKSTTVPVPAKPVTSNPWVFLYL
jgi:hypothetical protein